MQNEGRERWLSRAQASRRIWGGTFHAVATRLLRTHGQAVGLPPEFTILDRSDAEDLMNGLRSERELAKSPTRFPLKGTCLDIYSRCLNCRRPLTEVVAEVFPWCSEHIDPLKGLFDAYVDRKETLAVLDYDDLLLFWHALVSSPETGEAVRSRFDAILVDEYQDTNTLQGEILKALSPSGTGVTVVGDDAQSIYSFRGATVRNILEFPDQFPGTTVVTLEQNYRSSQPILDVANGVLAQAAEGFQKNLRTTRKEGLFPEFVHCQDESEQTQFVVDKILECRESGTPLGRQAVLFRAAHHSLDLELELARRNIPFHKYGGLKFIETAHVKDLLAFLRLAENPRDALAATRTLTLIPGIGPKKAQYLVQKLAEARGQFRCWQDYAAAGAGSRRVGAVRGNDAGTVGAGRGRGYGRCAGPSRATVLRSLIGNATRSSAGAAAGSRADGDRRGAVTAIAPASCPTSRSTRRHRRRIFRQIPSWTKTT